MKLGQEKELSGFWAPFHPCRVPTSRLLHLGVLCGLFSVRLVAAIANTAQEVDDCPLPLSPRVLPENLRTGRGFSISSLILSLPWVGGGESDTKYSQSCISGAFLEG